MGWDNSTERLTILVTRSSFLVDMSRQTRSQMLPYKSVSTQRYHQSGNHLVNRLARRTCYVVNSNNTSVDELDKQGSAPSKNEGDMQTYDYNRQLLSCRHNRRPQHIDCQA